MAKQVQRRKSASLSTSLKRTQSKAQLRSIKKNKAAPKKKASKQDKVLADDDGEISFKKRPSKAELKSVIETLKKDTRAIVVRKALRYVPYYLKSKGLTKKLLAEIIRLWSEAGESVRVVCLLVLIRIYTKMEDKESKQIVIKRLYASFLEKCRVTKHETMSMISFMRHSLIELYKLDLDLAFKQAQTCYQQLSMTLRTALTHKNEETYKTVLNWQFANCLILLSTLLTETLADKQINSLTTQIILLNFGALNILTSPRYYPYYCHLIENLIHISESSGLFVPVLPIIIGIIEKIDLPSRREEKKLAFKKEAAKKSAAKSKKPTKSKLSDDEDLSDGSEFDSDEHDDSGSDEDNSSASESQSANSEGSHDEDDDSETNSGSDDDEEDSIKDEGDKTQRNKSKLEPEPKKTYDMYLLNHVSLDEAHSLEYKSAVLNRLYELSVKYLAIQSHRISFPELVLMPRTQLKRWTRRNWHPEGHKFRVLLDKIKSDVEKIEAERHVDFAFTNYAAVDAWERKLRDSNKLSLPKLAGSIVH